MSDNSIEYNKSFDALADILEDIEESSIDLSSFDAFVQKTMSLSYPQYSFDTWHVHKVNNFLDDVCKTNSKIGVVVLPRYHLKSTICGYFFSIYRMLKSGGDGIYISYKEELATFHLSNIKEIIRTNPRLSPLFQDMRDRSESGIHYRVGSKRLRIFSSGIFGMKRGLHTDSVCIVPGTKVRCWNGYKNIEDIEVGTSVWTHLARCRKVSKTMLHYIEEKIIKLTLENNKIIQITKNHPILTKRGWIEAGNLEYSDVLIKLEYESKLKGKTYEDIYGLEKAKILKSQKFKTVKRIGHTSEKRGKTFEEIYGIEKASEIKSKLSNFERILKRKDLLCECGKIFKDILSSKRRYCSLKCYWKYSKCGDNFRAKLGNFKLQNNPNWQGGLSFEPYPIEFNSDLKKKIYIRDNYSCRLCGSKKIILCHHIDYNKDNNIEENLITLCKSCHAKTNNKRLEWMEYFINEVISDYITIHNGTKITKIENEFYCGKVYNLEVEEDNSYVGEGLIYHNCIVDDILGTVENPLNLSELEKAEKMFNQEVAQIPNIGCPMIIFGTVMDFSDLLFKLKDNPNIPSLWLPAIHPDPVEDPDREILWPARFSKEVLERQKQIIGWKAFSTEFLLMPVLAMEAFITREELEPLLDKSLKSHSIYRAYDKRDRNIVGGLDVGKRKNPSHLVIFEDDEQGNLICLCQEFWDGTEYVEQARRINEAIENFGIDRFYIDATRGEMEERNLPRQCSLIKFTGRGQRNQTSYASDFARYVERKQLKLIDDDRFISQITCMSNSLKAPNTTSGHADSFWSVALAIGAYQDYFAPDRKKGTTLLGSWNEVLVPPEKPTMMDDHRCKMCNKKSLETLEDGRIKCNSCFAVYALREEDIKGATNIRFDK